MNARIRSETLTRGPRSRMTAVSLLILALAGAVPSIAAGREAPKAVSSPAAASALAEADELLKLADEARDGGRPDEAAILYEAALGCYQAAAERDQGQWSDLARFRMRYCESQLDATRGGGTAPAAEPSEESVIPAPLETENRTMTPAGILGEARRRLQHGDADGARAILIKALRADPDDPQARLLLAVAQCQTGRFGNALQLLEALAEENPTQALVRVAMGIAWAGVGQMGEAADSLRDALALDPLLAEAHYNLAVVLTRLSPPEWLAARRHYRQAVALGAEADEALEAGLTGDHAIQSPGGEPPADSVREPPDQDQRDSGAEAGEPREPGR